MPLLLLPSELLLDIIDHASASDGRSAFRAAPSPNLIRIAATCRVLRSLSTKLLYSQVTVSPRILPTLHKHVTTDPQIAAYVRNLTLLLPGKDGLFQLHEILGSCANLRDLCLDWGKTWGDEMILGSLAQESKRLLQALDLRVGLKLVLEQCKFLLAEAGQGNFSELNSLTIWGDPYDQSSHVNLSTLEYLQGTDTEFGPASLGSVEVLSLALDFAYPFEFELPVAAGRYFAKLVPNVRDLILISNAECIYASLSTYADLGSHLTEIEIIPDYPHIVKGVPNPDNSPHKRSPRHVCEIIPKLSPKLRTFNIFSNCGRDIGFCHEMFAGDWPHIEQLSASCLSRCEGINSGLLRAAMEKLTRLRPRAKVDMYLEFMDLRASIQLVDWYSDSDKQYIAPLEIFEILEAPRTPESIHTPEPIYTEPPIIDDVQHSDNWVFNSSYDYSDGGYDSSDGWRDSGDNEISQYYFGGFIE